MSPIVLSIVYVLATHWVADFVCQTHTMAQRKSSSWAWLTAHVSTYTIVLGCLASALTLWPGVDPTSLSLWIAFNALAHLATDWQTSRWTASLWARGDFHNFFVVVGLDQLIHGMTLILTLGLLF